jgi:predicted alpha/beta hydrolase
MTPADSSAAPRPDGAPVAFEALDGTPLSGTWFVNPESSPAHAVVVVAPGGGIRGASYRRLARHVAGEGAAVLCFDYRGIGASRRGPLRGLAAGMAAWGRDDLGGAMAHAVSRFPSVPLGLVCHSIAGTMVGMARNAPDVRRIVLLAPHTAYFGDYLPRWRLPLFLAWHVLMPAATQVFGYFPGRALHLGEDLPRGFALEWAGRLHRDIDSTPSDRARWGALHAQYSRVTADALAISVSDDAFAPPAAARSALALYPAMRTVHKVVSPADLGVRRLGHMAFLRESTGPWFWREAAAWLLQREARVDYAANTITA